MKEWTGFNVQDFGFGLAVLLAFLYYGFKAWQVWVGQIKKSGGESKMAPPLETDIILKLFSEYAERDRNYTQILTTLTGAITELSATQKEIRNTLDRQNECMNKVQSELEGVTLTVNRHNEIMNEFRTQLAVMDNNIKK